MIATLWLFAIARSCYCFMLVPATQTCSILKYLNFQVVKSPNFWIARIGGTILDHTENPPINIRHQIIVQVKIARDRCCNRKNQGVGNYSANASLVPHDNYRSLLSIDKQPQPPHQSLKYFPMLASQQCQRHLNDSQIDRP
jgi:hypothetical protein